MKNKKIIALTMTAATVSPMAVPVFASNVNEGYSNVRTANDKEPNNTSIKEVTVSPMEIPVLASNVNAGYVNVRTANGRELHNTSVREADLKEYLRANSDKHPEVVGKAFIDGEAHYVIEIDMNMIHTENKDLKTKATKDLRDLKTKLEQLNKEQYDGKARYTFEVKEYTPSLNTKLNFYDGFTVVYV